MKTGRQTLKEEEIDKTEGHASARDEVIQAHRKQAGCPYPIFDVTAAWGRLANQLESPITCDQLLIGHRLVVPMILKIHGNEIE